MNSKLKILRDFFPTAIFTGRSLVFISEEHRVELTERNGSFGPNTNVGIRVRLFNKDQNGEFVGGHYEDFDIEDIRDLAGEIEKFVQAAVGQNIKE
ncbi:MAG: hypothetical protein JEZ07_17320 [Phycisphaerae bacterium]|nr:hypothetical protein [Phycisphaerae bacterium]